MREHTTLRQRLSIGTSSVPEPDLSQDTFYQVVKPAIAGLPNSGPKRHRALYQVDNWIVAAKRMLIEALAAGATRDEVLLVAERFGRAVRELLLRHSDRAGRPADLLGAILRETATNSFENLAALDVLAHESIGTIEAHWHAAYAQREASEDLMRQLERRAMELSHPQAA